MLTYDPKYCDLIGKFHSQIEEVCLTHNWDIFASMLGGKYICLESSRLTDLEALRTLLFVSGIYSSGEIVSTDTTFNFWTARKT